MQRSLLHVSFLLLVFSTPWAAAEEGAAEGEETAASIIEEVIVTATKREVTLQDLPLSVGVLTGEQIAKMGAARIDDYWRMIPSLNVKDGSFGGDTVIIRGLIDSDGRQQNQSMNAFYLDDTSMTLAEGLHTTSADPSLVDIARIEVLRGPQGTLFGANAMGGALRVITHEPDPEVPLRKLDMNVSNTGHGSGNYGGIFVLNQPVAADSAIRAVVFYQDDDGYIDDIGQRQNNINSEQRQGARVSWLWNVSEHFDMLARVYVEDIEVGGYNIQDPVGKPEVGLGIEAGHQVALLSPEPRDEQLSTLSLRLRWHTDWGEVYAASSWFEKDTSLSIDFSPEVNDFFGFYGVAPFGTNLGQQEFSQELRISSVLSGETSWLAGLYYLDQDAHRHDRGSIMGFGDVLDVNETSSRQDMALFGEIGWQISDKLEATLGARWYRIERDLASGGFAFEGPFSESVSGDDSDFIPKLSLSWDVSGQTMVYGLVSEGFRPGQFNNAVARSVCGARDILDSDELRNYEMGVRTRLANDRLSLNATAFHIDWKNMQTAAFVPGCPTVFKQNTGKASSDGLELDFDAVLTEKISLRGGFGYNNARLTGANPLLNVPSGTRIPNVPRLTASLGATLNFNWSGTRKGFFQGDVQYVGSRTVLFDESLLEFFPILPRLDAYFLFNARIGTESGHWRAELFVDNLFDELADLACCRLNIETAINRPRTIGVRSTYNF